MVYLIHFDKPYKHAKHYLGYCEAGGLDARIERHVTGNGSKLLAVIQKASIGWKVERVWEDGDRNFERSLKNHSATRYCPVCNPQSALKHKIK